jgi:hypothetical protein
MTIEKIVDKHYQQMFDELMDEVGDDLYDLVVEVKTPLDGKTVRRSWKDREKMIMKLDDQGITKV